MDVDRLKAQERIYLNAQHRADAQSKRTRFNHDQALHRIKFSAEAAIDRLNFKHDVLLPRMLEIDEQITLGDVEVRTLPAGDSK